MKNQRGNVHTYDYDASGRMFRDRVTTLVSGTDGYVRRSKYTFDDLSRVRTTAQWSAEQYETERDPL